MFEIFIYVYINSCGWICMRAVNKNWMPLKILFFVVKQSRFVLMENEDTEKKDKINLDFAAR